MANIGISAIETERFSTRMRQYHRNGKREEVTS